MLPIGKGQLLQKGEKVLLLTLGPLGNAVSHVLETLAKEGIHPGHFDVKFLKPLDESALEEFTKQYSVWITVEDGTEKGGLFSEIAEFLACRDALQHVSTNGSDFHHPQLLHIAIPDEFITHGDIPNLYKKVGFDNDSIEKTIRQAWEMA